MSFLLDTNVISELRRSRPDPAVAAWVDAQDETDQYLSAVTILEIELGRLRLARRDAEQASRLLRWIEHNVLPNFHGRILPFDTEAARRCAALHIPDSRSERDAMIAATALAHGMTIVTRNMADFVSMGVALHNPWLSPAQ